MKTKPQAPHFEHSSHHYLLAHDYLPSVVFSLPAHIHSLLASQESLQKLLERLMSNVDNRSNYVDKRTFSPSDIHSSEHLVARGTCVLLQMPPPTSPTEAYFVAVCSSKTSVELEELRNLPGNEGDQKALNSMSYFTLELAHPLAAGETGTVFCGRTPDGIHHFYASGPRPDPDVFVAFLKQFIEARSS